MPSFKDTLELVLHADASGAITELKNFAGETETQTKKAESSLQRITTGALKIGTAGMGAGALLTTLGDQATAATQQLDAAISAAGQSAEEYKGKIDEAVSSDEKFGHTAHETEGALTTLVGAYGDTGQALDRMQLVENLAAAKHESLAEAATQVAKAHGGAGRIFKEFDIQVQTNADGTKDYEGALDKLSKKVDGQASASMAGFTGWLKATGAAVEDDVASFAQKFGPAILGVSTGLTALGGIGQGASAVLGKLKGSSDEAGEATSGLGSKLGAAGIGAGAAIGVAALYELGQSLNKTGLDEQDLANITKLSFDQQAQFAVQLVEKFKGPFAGAVDDLIKKYEGMGDTGKVALQKIRDALKLAGDDTSKFDAAIAGMDQQQANAAEATDTTTQSLKDQQQALKDARDAVKKLDDAYKNIVDSTLASFEASLALSDAQINTRKAVDDLNKAQADGASTADDLSSKQNQVFEAILNEASANEKLVEAQDKANGKTTDGATAQAAIIAELEKVADTLAPGSALRTRLEDYVAELQNNIPQKVRTSVDLDVDQALKDLAAYLDYLDQINRGVKVFSDRMFVPPPPGYTPPPSDNPLAGLPPGLDLSPGDSPGRVHTTQNFYITTPEPVAAAHEVAQQARAQQFLR